MVAVLWRDFRFAMRAVMRNRGAAAVAVLTFAIGLSVVTVTFSLVNALLLRPLAAPNAERLVMIAMKDRHTTLPHSLSFPDYEDYAQSPVIEGAIAYRPAAVNLGADGAQQRVWAQQVTGGYFAFLGARALVGRVLTVEDDRAVGSGAVAVLSFGFWQRRFGGDPTVVGRRVQLNGYPFTIVGIMPRAFRGTESVLDMDLYVPMSMLGVILPGRGADLEQRDVHAFRVMVRLQRGVSIAGATEAFDRVARRLGEAFPETNRDVRAVAIPETRTRPDMAVGQFVPGAALAMVALATLVLVVAGANVANLLIAYIGSRRRELSIRFALGATSAGLLRQLLVEATMIALCGGLVALFIAHVVTVRLATLRFPIDLPMYYDLRLDWRVFFVAFGAAAVAGVGAGLVATKRTLSLATRVGLLVRGVPSVHQQTRRILVLSQVAVSTVLLVCAGLFARSLQNSWRVDLGFRPSGLVLMAVNPALQGYNPSRTERFYHDLLTRISTLPGVQGVSAGRYLPFGFESTFLDVPEPQAGPADRQRTTSVLSNVVSPGYFAVMAIPFVTGRDFAVSDDSASQRVAVVNAAFAARWWPGEDAVGKRLRMGAAVGQEVTVIGVVSNFKWSLLNETPRPMLILPFAQRYLSPRTLHAYTDRDPGSLVVAIRRQIAALDPQLLVYDATTMSKHVYQGQALLPSRVGAWLVGAFGLVGTLLAALGLYGVLSRMVAERRHEIGVRLAIGATPRHIVTMVISESMAVVAGGLVVGVALAGVLTRFLAALLFGVSQFDPTTFVSVPSVLLAVAFLASAGPAWQGARVDPLISLKVG